MFLDKLGRDCIRALLRGKMHEHRFHEALPGRYVDRHLELRKPPALLIAYSHANHTLPGSPSVVEDEYLHHPRLVGEEVSVPQFNAVAERLKRVLQGGQNRFWNERGDVAGKPVAGRTLIVARSEEHTSELQSHSF